MFGRKKALHYTAINYEFGGKRSLWDIYQNLQNPELYENEVKTHYIRAELFLRGVNANPNHLSNVQNVIGTSGRLSGKEYDFQLSLSGSASQMVEGGNAGAVIGAKLPLSDPSMIKKFPFHAPPPSDIYIKVLSPFDITNFDGSVDTFSPGVHHGDLKVYTINAKDPTVLDWFVRFSGIAGNGRDGFAWLTDELLPRVLGGGHAVVIGCGLNGMITHVLGSALPDQASEWAGVKSTETIDVSTTSNADLDRLDREYLENVKEQEAGRALGWLSWIYHPTQGIYKDDARYASYRQQGRFGA